MSSEAASQEGRRAAALLGALLLAALAVSTLLHHAFPAVLRVPSAQGVPLMGWGFMALNDLVVLLLSGLCYLHAWRRLGPFPATVFLSGSFVFTGLEESMWILTGRFDLIKRALEALGQPTDMVGGTYYFTRGLLWFIETPVYVCLIWFVVAYACVHAATLLFPRASIWLRAFLGGLLAVDLDLWLDPVHVHPAWQSWVWLSKDPVHVFSIPFSNFLGWFLLIFLFALVFERLPGMIERHGPGRAVLRFGALLLALEAGILLTFLLYGGVAQKLFPTPVNWTWWGI